MRPHDNNIAMPTSNVCYYYFLMLLIYLYTLYIILYAQVYTSMRAYLDTKYILIYTYMVYISIGSFHKILFFFYIYIYIYI